MLKIQLYCPLNMSRNMSAKNKPRVKGKGLHGHARRGHHRISAEKFSFHEADDRVYDCFRNHNFGDYPHEKRHQLVRFYQLLMEEQEHQNITRLLTLRDVAIKHFIDCLMIPKLTALKFPLLDIGTGPGFPGIPLKIHFPNQRIILAEGVQKRVEFLKKIRSSLGLNKLDIIGRNITPTFVYPIQGAITRAVEDMTATLDGVLNALQLGGEVYFMKGPNITGEIESALEKLGSYYELKENIPYTLPNSPHERRLVIFKKHTHPEPIDLERIIEEDYAGEEWSK